ncbi:unnamed protein product [Orchesella dallaii]|uniref:Uncharacterized protein n=1 Tax=Orchesella dallaii TaxID=48710 RepID=A0ABP1QES8_9HEXA
MSERELMILERRIRRNLKRSLKLSHEIHMSSSFRSTVDNSVEHFVGDGDGGVISPLLVANIYGCNSICGHNYHNSQYGNSPTFNAWWKARKATPSMIVSVPVRRLKKKKKKKCVKLHPTCTSPKKKVIATSEMGTERKELEKDTTSSSGCMTSTCTTKKKHDSQAVAQPKRTGQPDTNTFSNSNQTSNGISTIDDSSRNDYEDPEEESMVITTTMPAIKNSGGGTITKSKLPCRHHLKTYHLHPPTQKIPSFVHYSHRHIKLLFPYSEC